ncbi:MAG: 23S rRNA (adenine(2503)-C(2))-methyltransferase RlmN [Gammaproteobacteria bacterium]|nr:23S rRNA (adenine(2503)-C(2))-methyltransferase RlmN [Gammaproteobacteria bacterium]
MSKDNLLNFTCSDLEKFFLDMGEKKYRAPQVIKWIHQIGVTDFALMTNLSLTLRDYLSQHSEVKAPELIKELIAEDGTCKWLMQLEDGHSIETVYIPEGSRGTLCISSQVGCPLGCSFCATGMMGFTRDLTVAEIIGQLWLAVRKLSPDNTTRTHVITNVVFMGMGEPLLNYTNVLKSTELMLDDNAYGLSKYKVTVSTCGLVPEMLLLRDQSEVALAVSLHAPNDELRSSLMPINKKYPLKELIAACNNYFKDGKRQVTIEYIMLSGVNDKIEHAKQLVKLLSHGRYKVNLIPGNIVTHTDLEPSSQDNIDLFRQVLLDAGINTITRKSRGGDIAAACGQLAGEGC